MEKFKIDTSNKKEILELLLEAIEKAIANNKSVNIVIQEDVPDQPPPTPPGGGKIGDE